MSTLQKAIEIAVKAHNGQVDKVGAPYILHPLRVMFALKDLDEQIVGVLHDVIEDTPETPASLKHEGFSEQILEALDCVTKRESEKYEEFIERLKDNPIARAVKLADLEDNMNLLRLKTITEKDQDRLVKYHSAYHALVSAGS